MNGKYFSMEDNQSLNPLGFITLKLDAISEIISFTQHNKKKIIKEFSKLKGFYKANPEAFFYTLTESKCKLESKEELSELDKVSLKEINKMIEDYEDVEKYFTFQNDFLLETYQKIYNQLSKADLSIYTDTVDIVFYSLNTKVRDNTIPIGDFFIDGSLNTGSILQLEVMRISPQVFITGYQSLLN